MRRILTWLIAVPVLVAVVVFALHNKSNLALDLWPFGLVIELPVYLALAFALLAGALLGGMAAWAGQARMRASLRDQMYQGEVLRRELKTERETTERLQRDLEAAKQQARAPAVSAPGAQETLLPPDAPQSAA